jgi:hypothetical protein
MAALNSSLDAARFWKPPPGGEPGLRGEPPGTGASKIPGGEEPKAVWSAATTLISSPGGEPGLRGEPPRHRSIENTRA